MVTILSDRLEKFVRDNQPRGKTISKEIVEKIVPTLEKHFGHYYGLGIWGDRLVLTWINTWGDGSSTRDGTHADIPVMVEWEAVITDKEIVYYPNADKLVGGGSQSYALNNQILSAASKFIQDINKVKRVKDLPEKIVCMKIGFHQYACFEREVESFIIAKLIKINSLDSVDWVKKKDKK